MSIPSAAASSTLSRSRAAVLLVTTIAAAYGVYYLHQSVHDDTASPSPNVTLRRSNAVRRRRPTLTGNESQTGAGDIRLSDEDADIVAPPANDGDTVVDEQGFQDEYNWTEVPPGYQRTGQNIVQLLFRVSEDATRRSSIVHRGCGCNSCGVVPIRGIRYRCANCVDFDLCESCEAQGLHTKTHIFYKVKIPAPSFGPKHLQPVWYTGDPDGCQRMLPKELITKLSNETGYERPELDAYWEQWTYMANTEWREDPDEVCLAMDRKTFERCLIPSTNGLRHAAPSLIFDRMFAFYDTNKDNLIGFSEFLHGLAFRKKKDKWSKIFNAYDIDGDGLVDRKDFLRLFRAYYVMYRQMHREMLEGYDEQVINSTDAQQLVSGRQPLSSAFGRDGRFPAAPNPLTGVGKAPQANGEIDINDGRGVINASTLDTGNREEVFTRALPRVGQSRRRFQTFGAGGRQYAETLLNPPENVDQLTRTILNGLAQGSGFNTLDDLIDNSLTSVAGGQNDSDSSEDEEESRVRPESDTAWPPSNVTDAVVEEVLGPGFSLQADILKHHEVRQVVIAHAVAKSKARKRIHERWVHRQFYTDEEEGASPPADWDESEDILVREMIGGGESSKTQSRSRPLSPRSRSSSKVRFVEDGDDFDTRSNPSTSSRSIPERWGGMEIADAEKDAGKEILFQVAQQAFNELLDPIFKHKEDEAEMVAVSKAEMDKYRHLYTAPEFAAWAAAQQEALKNLEKGGTKKNLVPRITKEPPRPQSELWPGFPGLPESELEVEQVRRRPLPDLLAASGYSIANAGNENEAVPGLREAAISEVLTPGTGEASRLETSDTASNLLAMLNGTAATPSPPSPSNPYESASVSITEIIGSENDHRDPTLPQFRLNDATTPSSSAAKSAQESKPEKPTPDQGTLLMFWQIEQSRKEAHRRGGYGKLNFEEWEEQIKKGIRSGRGNSMDYLGSWIEFCIP